MLTLRYSTASPFARKCWIVAIEGGLEDQLSLVLANAFAADSDVPKANPLGKIPVLILDDGQALYDSPVICEYLDALAGGALFPAPGPARWTALRRQALADGLMDATIALRVETVMRPEDKRWSHWSDRQAAAVARALDQLEAESATFGTTFDIGAVSTVSALGYLDLRFPANGWRDRCPTLTAWYAAQQDRASVAKTQAKE